MKFIGLDLSLAETGFAVFEDGKSINRGIINASIKGTARLIIIADEIIRQVDLHNPICIAIEGVAYQSYTAVDTAELHGSVRSALHRAGYQELLHVAPVTLKKFATGNARAHKSDIKLELFKRWKIEERNDNKADAYILSRMAAVHRGILGAETKAQGEAIVSARRTTDKKEGRIARFKKKKKEKAA